MKHDRMPMADTASTPSLTRRAGEVDTVLTAPSVLNAVFAATGKRIRRLPFAAEELQRA